MPFFDDHGFYKRAQIVPNDLTLAGVAEFDDLDRLTIFADNLVPHVLRVDGVLRYDAELARADRLRRAARAGRRGARDPRVRGARLRADRRRAGRAAARRSTSGCGTAARSRATRRSRATGRAPSTTEPPVGPAPRAPLWHGPVGTVARSRDQSRLVATEAQPWTAPGYLDERRAWPRQTSRSASRRGRESGLSRRPGRSAAARRSGRTSAPSGRLPVSSATMSSSSLTRAASALERVGDRVGQVRPVGVRALGLARRRRAPGGRGCRPRSSRPARRGSRPSWRRSSRSAPTSIGPSSLAPEPTTTSSSTVGWRLPRSKPVPPSVTPW